MYNIAKASEQDRRVLFRNTAQQTGLHEAIIEKDFWVCLTLDHLFHHSPWKAAFTFKGGTSLSKCYGLIQRFSEDIDLILDWRVLGYGLYEPWAPRSNTKQDQFNKEANKRAEQFLRDILLPSLRSEFGIILGMEADLYIDPDDEQTICFRYPRKWAQYELARPGTMKLCPPEYRYAALEEDYAVMQGMMFGECPSFADLMAFIRELEAEINAL